MFHTQGLEDFSDEELYAELQSRLFDREIMRVRLLNINNITTKDFVVYIGDMQGAKKGEEYYEMGFMFYIKHDKKEYCIDSDYNDEKPKKWWPVEQDDSGNYNGAKDFIPNKLSESCENYYTFNEKITEEEAIKYLKKCGFTKFEYLNE